MPGSRLRPGPFGMALAAYQLWRRLPPSQRRRLIRVGRTHAPRVAAALAARRRARTTRP